jgi:hypothetical protein
VSVIILIVDTLPPTMSAIVNQYTHNHVFPNISTVGQYAVGDRCK